MTVLAPPSSRTSPVAVTLAVMLSKPDPTSESRTPSMSIESFAALSLHCVSCSTVSMIVLPSISVLVALPSSPQISTSISSLSVVTEPVVLTAFVIGTPKSMSTVPVSSAALPIVPLVTASVIPPASSVWPFIRPCVAPALTWKVACANAPMAIVMATSMQNAENANLIFI